MSDVETYVGGLRRREMERDRARSRLRQRWLAAATQAARILTDEFGARRVVLFGSVARGDVHEASDVDLWVEGIAPDRFFEAAGRLVAILPRVSLVPAEASHPLLRERALAEGIPLT
ncbi:MAG: nucleotidyltransferase domain-containing protein [Myxococcota bacterium]